MDMNKYEVTLRVESADGVVIEHYEINAESFSEARDIAVRRAMTEHAAVHTISMMFMEELYAMTSDKISEAMPERLWVE